MNEKHLLNLATKIRINFILSALIPTCLNNSKRLFYAEVGTEGKIIDFNPAFSAPVGKSMTAVSFENDIIHPDFEEQKQLISCQNICLENPGMIQSITLRNTVFSPSFNPVYWEVAYVESSNEKPAHFRWIGFLLYNEEEVDEERKKLEEELINQKVIRQNLLAQVAVDAQEKERANIGKELHDNISQMLTSTKLFLDILKSKTEDELVDRSIKNINAIIQEVRSLSRSLAPSGMADLGLIASLNDLFENIRATNVIAVEFYPDDETDRLLSATAKLTLYRIVQEQVNNILRHANAKQVFIELFPEEGQVELIVSDDGIGFDPETVKKGMGLENMRSRTALLNGKFDIIAAPGKGTKIKVVLPIN